MRFTITQKLTVTILLFISAGVGIVFYFILPAITSIRETTDAMVSQIASEDQELDRLRLLRRSLTEIDQIEKDLSLIDHISVTKGTEDILIKDIESIAKKHSIDQSLSASFSPDGGSPDFSGYYVFHFSAKGTFENVREYLLEIERLPYYFIIPKITIEKTTSNNSSEPLVLIQFSAILNSTSP